MKRGCYIYVEDLNNVYVVAKYELWPSVLLKTWAMVKDCVIVQIVNFKGGTYIFCVQNRISKQFQLSVFAMPLPIVLETQMLIE